MNGQEGILTLETGQLRRKIRILRTGLRPLNYAPNTPDFLKHIVLKQKLLSEAQFQNIFSTWVPGSSYPGDFLIARRILTKEQVTDQLLHQIQNHILELVVTPKLKYEFVAEAESTSYEMFAPDGLGEYLVLNGNAVLMEGVRREDDWLRIREVIPSSSEIFTASNKGALNSKRLAVNPKFIQEIRPLLNGENSLDRIVAATTLSAFEVHETVVQLVKLKVIRPLNTQEKRTLAEKLRRSLRTDDAIDIYRSILADAADDQQTRLSLIALLEKRKDQMPALAEHYLAMAHLLAESDPVQCKAYVQKSLAISPHDIPALETLFNIHQASGNQREALATTRGIVLAAKIPGNTEKAIDLLYKIVNFYPEEAMLFHELAQVHLMVEDTDSAVDCLKAAADFYEHRKEHTKLRRTYEQIVRLRPSESWKLKKVSEQERWAKFSFVQLFKFSGASLAVGALLCGILYLAFMEYSARVLYAQILKDVEKHKEFGQLTAAKTSLEDFKKMFPFSTRTGTAQDYITQINRLAIQQREEHVVNIEKRRISADSALAFVRLSIEKNDYVKAASLLEQVDIKVLTPAKAKEVLELRRRLDEYFKAALDLLVRADIAEKNQEFQKSYDYRLEIIAKHSNSPAALNLRLPIQVETSPPGAEVVADGKSVGKTPMLLRLPLKNLPQIVLSKPGYMPHKLTYDISSGKLFTPLESHKVLIRLTKNVEWTFAAGAPIEGFPVTLGDNVCFGARNGKITCLRQDTGAVVWSFSIPGSMDFTGGLGVWNNLIYFGSFDGKVYVLEGSSGKLAFNPFPASTELWPIKYAASQPSERGFIAVNCDRKQITAFHLSTGRHGWSLPFTQTQVLGEPQAFQGKLYIATSGGEILEIDHEAGKVLRRAPLGFEPSSRGRVSQGHYFIGSPQGRLLCLNLKRLEPVWSQELGEGISSPPTVDGDWVFVPTASGKIRCFSTTGKPKWTFESSDSIHGDTDGTLFRNFFLIGTRSGTVLCIDIWSGQRFWSYATAGAFEKEPKGMLSCGVVSKGRFFIGSEDHNFYVFSLD